MGSLEADDGDIVVKNFEPFVSFLIFLSDFETMLFNKAWTLVTLYIIFVNFWSHLFENVFFIVIEVVLPMYPLYFFNFFVIIIRAYLYN